MVVGKPYIHFKINNEPLEVAPDYNYTWATTIEATKGPVNEPTLVSSANQAYAIFGVDMRPYFAQGAGSLIIVRVAATSSTKTPTRGIYSFVTKSEIKIYRAEQKTFTTIKTYQTGARDSNNQLISKHYGEEGEDGYDVYEHAERTYVHKLYYVDRGEGQDPIPVIEHRDANGKLIPGQFIDTWHKDGRVITPGDVNKANAKPEHTVSTLKEGDGMADRVVDGDNITPAEWDEEDYKQTLVESQIFRVSRGAVVKPWLEPKEYTIQPGTALFEVTSKYEGDYGITVSIIQSEVKDRIGYTIVLTDPSLGTLRINNAYDPVKIVNRINDRGFNFEATLTNAGKAISEAMSAYPPSVDVFTSNAQYGPLIKDAIPEHTIVARSINKNNDQNSVSYLTSVNAETIKLDEENGTSNATVRQYDYAINLMSAIDEPLLGSSNGEWDYEKSRIPIAYQKDAHKKGLNLLRRLRIAGVFCMYGENDIQSAYVEHGLDPIEPEKGMNNNETCKWRTILLGSNQNERDSKAILAAKASALNNQYILLLGQGLIDSGYNGIATTMNEGDRIKEGIYYEHQLLPFECTQYIAGLRSKLGYDESIFGGQNRKRIRGVGDLEIAPLFEYDDKYEWDPNTYTYLNEAGVLTFTEEYGNITLTDGVTTCQTGFEEDEEGVMNILKYAQNGIYNICLPYIGRNINADLEQSINMEIQSFLEVMKSSHQSLIDTDEFNAYEFLVSLGSRNTQLLGKIFIYLKITPVHALRQIEVEMTVQ